MASSPTDYPYIRAWGKNLGSFTYYIDDQVALAKQEGAPETATHRNADGTWSTVNDIKDQAFKSKIVNLAERIAAGRAVLW